MGSQRGRNAQRSQEHLFQRGHRRDGKRPTKGKEEDHEGAPGRLAAVQGRRHQRERGDLRKRHGRRHGFRPPGVGNAGMQSQHPVRDQERKER
jgi:hypothetical protein